MSAVTVYQFGNYYVSKDMVFGWAIREGEVGNFLPLANINLPWLEYFLRAYGPTFPACVPEDFVAAIRAEVAEAKKPKLALVKPEPEPEKAKEEAPAPAQPTTATKDQKDFINTFIAGLPAGAKSDLGYGIFKHLGSGFWEFQQTNQAAGTEGFKTTGTFDGVMSAVMRKFW